MSLTPAEFELLEAKVEACLFVASSPLTLERIARLIERDHSTTEIVLHSIQKKCVKPSRGIEIVAVSGGYQLRTKKEQAYVVESLSETHYRKLTPTELHILSIIAYKQPISRSEIEAIRGSGVFHVLTELTEVGLIEVMGKSEYEGAYLYRAAPKFLEVFGLESFAHLPPLNIEQERESEFPDPDEDFAKLKASLKPIVSEPSPLKWDDPETEAKDAKILAEIGRQIAGLKTTASPYIEPHRNGTY